MTNELLREAARGLRRHRLHELVRASTARLILDEPDYLDADPDELRLLMVRTIDLALARVAGETIPPALATAAYESGQVRAEQGVPLSSVLHSFRIDLRVLWEALITEGRRLGAADDPEFVQSLLGVWEAVEANIADVVAGYRQTAERLSRGADAARAAALQRLASSGDEPGLAGELAVVLGMPVDGRFLCVAADFPDPRPEVLSGTAARLGQRGARSQFTWTAGELIGIVLLEGREAAETVGLLEELEEVACGVVDVAGLAGVARGLRLARVARRSAQGTGIVVLRENWAAAVATADPELAAELASDVFGAVWQLPLRHREAMIESVRAFVDGDGSVSDAARRTFRHRNTVHRRLQEFEALTGLDLTRPRDVAVVCTVLHIVDRLPAVLPESAIRDAVESGPTAAAEADLAPGAPGTGAVGRPRPSEGRGPDAAAIRRSTP